MRNDNPGSALHFREALRLNPQVAEVRLYLAIALARQGLIEEPLEHHRAACKLNRELDLAPELLDLISVNLAKAGRFPEAAQAARKALAGAQRLGNQELARELAERIEDYDRRR